LDSFLRTLIVTTTREQQSRKEISRSVRQGLAQHLIGTLLAAKALAGLLAARKAYETAEADRLVALLKAANKELQALVDELEAR
jgi:signal transduction histidine kinase